MQVQEILIIKNGIENYGISTEDINQISRVPTLMPLPLRPSGVRGLCAVSGSIVSLLDLNQLLDMKEVEYDAPNTRLISLNNEFASNALLVSEVFNTVEIQQENIEYIDKENDPVIGIYKYNEMLVQVLSLEILIEKINKVSIESKEVKQGKVKQEIEREEESNRFLTFAMQDEKFALNIDYLQEILLADKDLTEIAGTSKEVLGLITLREELLLVVDLREYYGFKTLKSEKNRILVASYEGKKVGLLIDSILDINNFLVSDIEYMPEAFEGSKISGVIHAKNSLISFFDNNVLEDIFLKNDAFIDQKIVENQKHAERDKMEVIVFKLLDKEYAFEVDSVDEIIDIVSYTDVAFSDDFVDGIINIRGQVVTVVSLYEHLNVTADIKENSKIIVCNIDDVRVGFIVESVSDILEVDEEDIREEESELFTHILHLDGGERLVLTMDVNSLTSKGES